MKRVNKLLSCGKMYYLFLSNQYIKSFYKFSI